MKFEGRKVSKVGRSKMGLRNREREREEIFWPIDRPLIGFLQSNFPDYHKCRARFLTAIRVGFEIFLKHPDIRVIYHRSLSPPVSLTRKLFAWPSSTCTFIITFLSLPPKLKLGRVNVKR